MVAPYFLPIFQKITALIFFVIRMGKFKKLVQNTPNCNWENQRGKRNFPSNRKMQ